MYISSPSPFKCISFFNDLTSEVCNQHHTQQHYGKNSFIVHLKQIAHQNQKRLLYLGVFDRDEPIQTDNIKEDELEVEKVERHLYIVT